MRNTFSYQFYCRESKASKKTSLAPVELSLVVNGKRVFINLPYKADPREFNKKRRPQELEAYLSAQRQTVGKVLAEMAENGIPVTAETLRFHFRNGGVNTETVADHYDAFLSILKQRVGSTLTKGVYRKYELVRDLFYEDFNPNQEVKAITNSVVRKYYAKLDSLYQNATSVGYKTKFKSFITYLLDNGLLTVNPMQGIRITKEKKEIDYLTEEEIKSIVETTIENKSLSDVRDAFVLQLSTGLAYADIHSLKKEDIHIAEDGTHYIVKPRVKTGTTYTTVILKDGVDVLKKHNYELRVISNQKYNEMLKAIQVLCGIEKRITTHLARHTFAQRLLSSGVRLETVSRALGHANTKVTQQFYCKVRTNDIIREIKNVMV